MIRPKRSPAAVQNGPLWRIQGDEADPRLNGFESPGPERTLRVAGRRIASCQEPDTLAQTWSPARRWPFFAALPDLCCPPDGHANFRCYATIGTKFSAVGQCRIPHSKVEQESARQFRDKLSNFSRLKPLVLWKDLPRPVLSTTKTNHSGELVIRKFLSTDIQLRHCDRSLSIPVVCLDCNSKPNPGRP